ncbi:MAG: GNAT family N-acetyltransferase [Salinibacter sp.]
MEIQRDRSAGPDATAVAKVPLDIVEVGLERLDTIRRLNVEIFDDTHIIETFERDDLLILLAQTGGTDVGFKLGYRLDEVTFYSAKGGVHPAHRRNGIARALLYAMLDVVKQRGYERFVYDTFPNKHPGMTVLGLDEGFEVIRAGYSAQYQDYRLRFEWDFEDADA